MHDEVEERDDSVGLEVALGQLLRDGVAASIRRTHDRLLDDRREVGRAITAVNDLVARELVTEGVERADAMDALPALLEPPDADEICIQVLGSVLAHGAPDLAGIGKTVGLPFDHQLGSLHVFGIPPHRRSEEAVATGHPEHAADILPPSLEFLDPLGSRLSPARHRNPELHPDSRTTQPRHRARGDREDRNCAFPRGGLAPLLWPTFHERNPRTPGPARARGRTGAMNSPFRSWVTPAVAGGERPREQTPSVLPRKYEGGSVVTSFGEFVWTRAGSRREAIGFIEKAMQSRPCRRRFRDLDALISGSFLGMMRAIEDEIALFAELRPFDVANRAPLLPARSVDPRWPPM